MKVKSITVKGNEISSSTVNLLVGANNTGKSTLLREIYASVTNRMINENDSKWLDRVRIENMNFKTEVDLAFKKLKHYEDFSQIDNLDQRIIAETIGFTPFRGNMRQNLKSYGLSALLQSNLYSQNMPFEVVIEKLQSSSQIVYTEEMQAVKLLADIGVVGEFCDTRLGAGFSTSVQDILQDDSGDQSPVRHMRENGVLLKNIQLNIFRVFGVKIGFDNLQQGQKPLRILPNMKFPSKLSQKDLAIKWRDESPLIDSQGDGLRAYLRLALSLLDQFSSIIFIDEPETFLHPPQRRALGVLIADMAKEYDKQVFISTHDSDFIRGLLNSGSDVKVLNLKNKLGEHTVVELDLRDIKSVLSQRGNRLKERAPILNEGILNSLFYDKTILTEDENDRVFYEYYSMLRHGTILQNKRLIGLRGKDEVINLMDKLYGIGVNVACIVDIDFILDRYAPSFIKDANQSLHSAHVAIRQQFSAMPKSDRDMFRARLKSEGLRGIEDELKRREYSDLIYGYSQVGIYIPPVGELESWTKTSKNNLSQMLRIIEARNPRELNRFMKVVLA